MEPFANERTLRPRKWTRVLAAAFVPLMLVYCDPFFKLFPEASAQDSSSPPPPANAFEQLEKTLGEIEGLLSKLKSQLSSGADATGTVAELSTKNAALDGIKSDLDSELETAKTKIVASGLSATMMPRWNAFKDTFNAKWSNLKTHLSDVLAAPTVSSSNAAIEYVKSLQFKPNAAELDLNKLPHRSQSMLPGRWSEGHGLFMPEMATTMAQDGPTPADLAATEDAKITPEIVALAASLNNNPAQIYEFVRNNFRYEPYRGSVKGSVGTLREKAGNDVDQASLTIALLRAAGIPARYLRGTIRVSIADLKAWLGVQSDDAALNLLKKNEIPATAIAGGGTIAAVEMEHTLVRAFIDYTPYRGASGTEGEEFLDFDPSFKRTKLGVFKDVAAQVGFDPAGFLEQVKKSTTAIDANSVQGVPTALIKSTVDQMAGKVQAYLQAQELGAKNAYLTREIEKEEFGIIPVSLPYELVGTPVQTASLADSDRQKVTIRLFNPDMTESFVFSAFTTTLAQQRITLSYEGATPDDQAAIAANAAEADFPAYLVKLVPKLRLDGAVVASGAPVGMGFAQRLRMEFARPVSGTVSAFEVTVTAGSYNGIGLDLQRVTGEHLKIRKLKLEAAQAALEAGTPIALDDVLGEVLASMAASFFFQHDTLSEITAGAYGVVFTRDTSAAIASYGLQVTNLFDLPFTVRAKTLTINVPRDVQIAQASDNDAAKEKRFLLSGAITGSVLEATSITSFAISEAVSTVKGLEKANAAGQKVFKVTAANAATVVPLLTHSNTVKARIQGIAEAGREVIVPQGPIVVSGVPVSTFVVVDPVTLATAMEISFPINISGSVLFTEQLKAAQLLVFVDTAGYKPLVKDGAAWFKSVVSATEQEAGTSYIAAIAAINVWFKEPGQVDLLAMVASAIAVSEPLQFIAKQPGIFNVSVSPEFVSFGTSPPGQVQIKATVTRGATWTVKVYPASSPTTVLFTKTDSTPEINEVFTSMPATAPDDVYVVKFEATKDGVTATPRARTFTVDSTAPTATLVKPAESEILKGINVEVTGTAADPNFQKYTVEILPSSGPAQLLAESFAQKPTEQRLAVWPTTLTPNGAATVRLRVLDKAGNTTVVTRSVTVDNDITAPTVNFASPSAGSTLSGTTTVTITASDNDKLSVVKLFVDGTLAGSKDISPPAATATVGFTIDTHLFSNGTHTLSASAEDVTGNTGTTAIGVTISNGISEFSVAPNPFSPNGDGFDDFTTIKAKVAAGTSFVIKIEVAPGETNGGFHDVVDGAAVEVIKPPGTVLRSFSGVAVGGSIIQPWDGRTDEAKLVLNATYLVRIFIPDATSPTDQAALPVQVNSNLKAVPIAQIVSPAHNGEVLGQEPVIASINIAAGTFSFTLKLEGEGTSKILASGTNQTSFSNKPLGIVDATLLVNGEYTLTLQATNAVGQGTEFKTTIFIVGEQKIGNVQFTLPIMQVPVQGIPISVSMTYDSYVKSTKDFGTGGWQLDVVAGNLKESADHHVTGRLHTGQRTRFTFDPKFVSLPFVGTLQFYVTARYTDRRGVNLFLESLGDQDLIRLVDPVTKKPEFRYLDGSLYNPPGWKVRDQRGNELTYLKSEGGRLTKVEEPNGNFLTISDSGIFHSTGKSITIGRHPDGRIDTITDPAGKFVKFNYSLGDLLAEIVDREGNVTKFFYDPATKVLVKIIDARGVEILKAQYDAAGRVIGYVDAANKRIGLGHNVSARVEEVTDRRGNVTRLFYNEEGLVVRQENADGGVRQTFYDADLNPIMEVDEVGWVTQSQFDQFGNRTSITDAENNTTLIEYNERGQPTRVTDPLGRVTLNEYDADGNLIRTTDPLGNKTEHVYDAFGRLVLSRTVASNGSILVQTQFLHDAFGNVIEQRVLDGAGTILRSSSFVYTENGLVKQRTENKFNPSSGVFEPFATTNFFYNANGQPTIVADPLATFSDPVTPTSHFTKTIYSAIGQVVATFDKNGNKTEFVYNSLRQLVKIIYPAIEIDGVFIHPTEEFGYDENGNQIFHKTRLGGIRTTDYDAMNRPFKVTNEDGTFRTNLFDLAGRRIKEIDENGNAVTFVFDRLGRVIRTINALGETTTAGFDAAGQQVFVRDGLGRTTRFGYDAAGRETEIEFADGTRRLSGFDALGRKIFETDENGVTTFFGYAPTGELIEVRQPNPADPSVHDVVTKYIIDTVGDKVAQIDAEGRTTRFGYTKRHELAFRQLPMGQTEFFEYDPQGNLVKKTKFDGSVIKFTWNALNLMKEKLFPDGSKHSFTYNLAGQRTSFFITGQGTTIEERDIRGRWVAQFNPDGTFVKWGYDGVGNRTRLETLARVDLFGFDPANRLILVTHNGVLWATLKYNAAGDLVERSYVNGTRTEFKYNMKSQVVEITHKRKQVGTTLTSYLLDPALKEYWKLEESSAPFVDSKDGFDLTSQGTDSLAGQPGRKGSAVKLGASKDAFLARSPEAFSFPGNEGTILMHYKPNASFGGAFGPAATQRSLYSTVNSTSTGFEHVLGIKPDGSVFFVEPGVFGIASGPQEFDATKFEHVAVTWKAGVGATIYKNGTAVATSGFSGFGSATQGQILGNDLTAMLAGVPHGANGTIDEAALFTRALSGSEVNEIAKRGLEPEIEEVFARFTYERDATGKVTKATELPSGRVVEYRYDSLNRLIQEKITASNVTVFDYQLDKVGNRLKKTETVGATVKETTYEYNANDELLTETRPDGVITRTYDLNGNTLTEVGAGVSRTFGWNFEDRLISFSSTVTGAASFEYDVDGLRTRKSTSSGETRFVLDKNQPFAQVLEERDVADTIARAYVYADDLASQEIPSSGSLSFYHYDVQFSARRLTDVEAQVTDSYTFDAFGLVVASSGLTLNNYLYTGEQFDPGLQLYYLRARYLNHASGRFVSGDPLDGTGDDPVTFHRYLYARGEPLTVFDFSGLFEEPDEPPPFGLESGRKAHDLFFRWVVALHPTFEFDMAPWGGSRLRPDVYDPQGGRVWELKPITWRRNPAKLSLAVAQLQAYIDASSLPLERGASRELASYGQDIGMIQVGNSFYVVKIFPAGGRIGNLNVDGLLFYNLYPLIPRVVPAKRPATEPVPEPRRAPAPFPRPYEFRPEALRGAQGALAASLALVLAAVVLRGMLRPQF